MMHCHERTLPNRHRRTQTDTGRISVFSFRPAVVVCVGLWLLLSVAACGKKGPPLAPLNMAPEAPGAIVARRLGDTVYLEMKVPSKSSTGVGPYAIDRIDVYAVTVAPGTVLPPNRDLLKPEHVIAKLPVAPPPDPDAPEPDTPEKRPRPGETITFVEALTPAALTPQVIGQPPKVEKPRTVKKKPKTLTPAAPAVPPPPAGPLVLTRLHVVQGVSSRSEEHTSELQS